MISLNAKKTRIRKALCALVLNNLIFSGYSYAQTNITVDDQFGDPVTGQMPVYLPNTAGVWSQGTSCSICLAKPDVSQAFEHTWHDTTQQPDDPVDRIIQINFNGIDFILPLFESLRCSQPFFRFWSYRRCEQIFTYIRPLL